MSCMDLIHCTIGIYVDNCYWWTHITSPTNHIWVSMVFYYEIIENIPFLIKNSRK